MNQRSPRDVRNGRQGQRLLSRLEKAILRHGGGFEQLRFDFPAFLRRTIDEVIDTNHSDRVVLDELKAIEKAYLGIKIQILLGDYLSAEEQGVLGLVIDGVEANVNATIGKSWLIPFNALGRPCILIQANERTATCSFGIVIIQNAILNRRENRERERTISKIGLRSVRWLLKDEPYPRASHWRKGGVLRGIATAARGQLPLDPEMMNSIRADWAGEALEFFEVYGERHHFEATVEMRRELAQQNLSDLIADLAHLCDRSGQEMRDALRLAIGSYEEETEGSGMQFYRRISLVNQ